MAPCNGTTSTPPKLAVTLPSPHTLQQHPAVAPSNGTTSTPSKLAVTLPSPHTLQQHPAVAPSNGTTSTAPCNGTLVPRPIRQSGSSPSPYSYRYLGENGECSTATPSMRGPKCGVSWHVLVALQPLETSVCLVTVIEPLLTLSLNVPDKAEPQIHPETNSQDHPSWIYHNFSASTVARGRPKVTNKNSRRN